MPEQRFHDRIAAGKLLADLLLPYHHKPNTLVLALPRGGVPVAFEIAKKLHLPLDLCLVRKLGVPGEEELAMGAISIGDVTVFNQSILEMLLIPREQINKIIEKERRELARRNTVYRHDAPLPKIAGQTIILVDDGIATGATMKAAIAALKQLKPAKIIVAVPVAAADTYREIKQEVDDIICPLIPGSFYGVGNWYEEFPQTSDDEVIELLKQATRQ